MNWFDVFLGMRANDIWREHQAKKREREWVDREVAKDTAIRAQWNQLESEALAILRDGYQHELQVTDALLERGDRAGYLASWADWGRRSIPTLRRVALGYRAVDIPPLVPLGTTTGWISVKFDFARALDDVTDGAELWAAGESDDAESVVQGGMDKWGATFEYAMDNLTWPEERAAFEQRYQAALRNGR